MPPRTRLNNRQSTTRKRQASNVDETANKRPKVNDNENDDEPKQRKKKQKGKGSKK